MLKISPLGEKIFIKFNQLDQMIIEICIKMYFFKHKSKICMHRKQLDLGENYIWIMNYYGEKKLNEMILRQKHKHHIRE